MSVKRKTKRPAHGRRRVDLGAMREALADGKVYTGIALVVERDGSHFTIEDGDVLVELELMPSEEPLTARMGAAGGGSGVGIWFIPPAGSEVAVLVPDGELACGPIIVGVLSSGALPADVAAGVTVIANSSVLVTDGTTGAEELATKADLQTVRDELHTHEHMYIPTSGTPGPAVATTGGPSVTAPTGTAILKAK